MAALDTLDEFLTDRKEMGILRGDVGKAQLCYLADIFGKLNSLSAELQGTNKALLDSKTNIFGFVCQYRVELSWREFVNSVRLSSCDDVSDRVLNVITSHLQSMVTDFMQRFVDLSEMGFPGWLTQYKLVDLVDFEQQFQNELVHFQTDSSAEVVHKAKRQFMWLDEEIVENYPTLSKHAQNLLLPFPTSYLVEWALSAVADILTKKRGSLNVIDRSDLWLKLTKNKAITKCKNSC